MEHGAGNTLLGACDWISLQVGKVGGCEQCEKQLQIGFEGPGTMQI